MPQIPKNKAFFAIFWQFLGRTDVFFVILFWLMVLLVAGTIAQKDIGLYMAQQRYFNSWILLVNGLFPLPGGAMTLGMLGLGLLSKLSLEKWCWKKSGTLLLHGSVLVLLLGGLVTALFSQEGQMVIAEKDTVNFMNDPYKVEIALKKAATGKDIAVWSEEKLQKGMVLRAAAGAVVLEVESFYANTRLEPRKEPVTEGFKGMLTAIDMQGAPRISQEEMNRAGVVLWDKSGENSEKPLKMGIFVGMPIAQTLEDGTYVLEIRPKRTYLPFKIRLNDFKKTVYPGTDMAKSYSSDIILTADGVDWPARIEMNKPLRWRGYTLYQASFDQTGRQETSVLAVVHNIGRLFPYLASLVMALGLLIHLFQRVPKLLLIAALLWTPTTYALDIAPFEQLPILEDGRLKPLDTYARTWLKKLTNKDHVDDLDASAWLAELVFTPQQAYQRRVFYLSNPEVVDLLKLEPRAGHRYTFVEVGTALRDAMPLIDSLTALSPAALTPAQSQLLDLYVHNLWYFDTSRSLTLLLPYFDVSHQIIAQNLGVNGDKALSYLNMLPHKNALLSALEMGRKGTEIGKKGQKRVTNSKPDNTTTLYLGLASTLKQLSRDERSHTFTIVPPTWDSEQTDWVAPWQVFGRGAGSPVTAAYLQQWQAMAEAWLRQDERAWEHATSAAWETVQPYAANIRAPWRLTWEVAYNHAQLFNVSFGLYLASFIAILLSGLAFQRFFIASSACLLGFGWLCHAVGLGWRVVLLNRPPVGTLYESIIFVGFIVVLGALLFFWRKRHLYGLIMGSVPGALLQLIGLTYAAGEDSMGMLAAVLNTNFWLATHVVVISIGYGTALVAGTLGHIYLLHRGVAPQQMATVRGLLRATLATALIALFFSTFGTILGGIWADQSWGRFWGWDPKENGALLLVLWLAWLLHGRVGGVLSAPLFAAGIALTNVVVALAWFGVNLLGIGLHSYGFTQNIALNLALFCGAEALLITALLGGVLWRERARG